MGVHGLWQLLQPTGRPVTLESLQGKVLAVDVSVWLHQSMKGMRDRQGNALQNAHLQVMFNRVSKLLFYRIKPVFVFDGGVPALKKQTLAARRLRREEAAVTKDITAKKLLKNVLKHHAVSAVLGNSPSESTITLPATKVEKDMFQLPVLPETDRPEEPYTEDVWEERLSQRQEIFAEFQNLEDIDIESDDFKNLPADIKHEILSDLKDNRRHNSWAVIDQLPSDSSDFSNYQMAKLMKQNKLTQKIENVRKELNSSSSGDIAANLTKEKSLSAVESHRVVSDDTTHYILIKGLSNNTYALPKEEDVNECDKNDNQHTHLETEGEIEDIAEHDKAAKSDINTIEQSDINTSKQRKTILERYKEEEELKHSFSDINCGYDESGGLINSQPNSSEAVKGISTDDQCVVLSPESVEDLDYSMEGGFCKEEEQSQVNEEKSVPKRKLTEHTTDIVNKKPVLDPGIADSTSQNGASDEMCTVKPVQRDLSENISTAPKEISSPEREDIVESPSYPQRSETLYSEKDVVQLVTKNNSVEKSKVESKEDEAESDSDDFIEVTINPNKINPDDLFPASIFHMENKTSKSAVIDVEIQSDVSKTDAGHNSGIQLESNEKITNEDISIKEKYLAEFEGVTDAELEDIQLALEQEASGLAKEKGKQERLATSITDQMQKEVQELLDLFGVPFVVSPTEAEAQCAFLDLTDQTQGTITDDSDIWLFGGRKVYRNFFNQSKSVEHFTIGDIEKKLLMDREKMIQLSYLCGCDYTEGIQGVGPVTALEVLLEFPGGKLDGLNALKTWWEGAQKQVKIPTETKLKGKLRTLQFSKGFPNALVYEAFINPTVDESEEKFSWGSPDLDLLRDFANDKLGWAKTKVDEILLPVLKELNKTSTQSSIMGFIVKEPVLKSPVKSKRVNRVLTRMKDQSVQESKSVIKTKGKSSKKLPAKNKKTKQISVNGGGWVGSTVLTSGGSQQDLNLSESSSDSDA